MLKFHSAPSMTMMRKKRFGGRSVALLIPGKPSPHTARLSALEYIPPTRPTHCSDKKIFLVGGEFFSQYCEQGTHSSRHFLLRDCGNVVRVQPMTSPQLFPSPVRHGVFLPPQSPSQQKRLWTGVKAWKELTESWLQTPFTEIDAAVLEKHVTLYQRTCHQAVKGLPSNPVAKRLKARRTGFLRKSVGSESGRQQCHAGTKMPAPRYHNAHCFPAGNSGQGGEVNRSFVEEKWFFSSRTFFPGVQTGQTFSPAAPLGKPLVFLALMSLPVDSTPELTLTAWPDEIAQQPDEID